jgi:GT2 family glycosyltransferase
MTTGRPDISVCIANYNGGDLVLDCLDSVFNQQGAFQLEVLVHDDASSDDSPQRISSRFPQARIIASDANCGFCISNNRMADAATGRFLLLLNNDAVLRPDTLQRLLKFAEDGHEDCILGLPQYAMADGKLVDRGYRTDPFLNPISIFDPATHEVGVATGACLWVPKQTWEMIGGFPSWFESVAEDIYLCIAARLLGHRVFVLDGPGFDHWIGRNLGGGKLVEGGLRTTVRRRALSERNKTFAMLCCYPLSALLLLMPIHAVSLACEALFLLIVGTGWEKVRRIYSSIPGAIWLRRKEIKELRRRLTLSRRDRSQGLFAHTVWLPYKLTMLVRHGRPDVR